MIASRMMDRLVRKARKAARELPNRFRRLAAMPGSPAPCVYDWSNWNGTLIMNIVPRAKRIRANFEENPQELAARLPRRARTMLLHLDISDNAPFIANPAEFVRIFAERNISVLNCQAPNIRKSTVQSCCISYGLPSAIAVASGNPDELLIVKTDLNTGGTREQQLSAAQKVRFNLPASISRLQGPAGYYVKRRAELSADIWNDPQLVVQRFVQNPAGRFFRVYVAVNAVVISEAYVDSQIKRIGKVARRVNHWLWRRGDLLQPSSGNDSNLPAALLHTAGVFINRFHLDYGAIDVVESGEGEFYVIDVNKTPFWDNEHQPGLLQHLRLGFQSGYRPPLG
jgi:hypothetical protein